MSLTAWWILLTAPGLIFAVLSVIRGRAFVRRTLRPEHPELLSSWRVETIRDALLAATIGCLAGIGLVSVVGSQFGNGARAIAGAIGLGGLFLALLLLDVMAFLNYWLRWGSRR